MARKKARKAKGPSRGPLSPQKRAAITRKARAQGKNPKRVLAALQAQQRKVELKEKRRKAALKGWAKRRLKKTAKSVGRQKTKRGRPLNVKRGKAVPYTPKTVRGETVRDVERFDFRGLEPAQYDNLIGQLIAAVNDRLRSYSYVALRLLIAMTPAAAAKRIISPKKYGKREVELRIADEDTRPIVNWTPFHKLESSLDAVQLIDEHIDPLDDDGEELFDESEGELATLLIAELTWSTKRRRSKK